MGWIVLALMILTSGAWADETTLTQLMHTLAQHPQTSATFTEKKYLAMVKQPLVATGTLLFRAPDHLEKTTLQPQPESLILEGTTLTLERSGHRSHTISLDTYPEIAGFIEGIRGTLQGNIEVLQKNYLLHLNGYPGPWTLSLNPREASVSHLFKSITIQGNEAAIQQITITQQDGDHAVMTIVATLPPPS